MIKNVKLKRFLVDAIFPVFSVINRVIPKDENIIFFYCANDELNDNSKAVFDYLIENDYYKKYKIVCGVGDPQKYSEYIRENIKFISKKACVTQYMKSGHVLYSMGKIPIKPTRNQIVINMWHGIPLKKIGLMSNVSNGKEFFFTYVCASSETWKPVMSKAFGCPEENVCICGEPKADKLIIPRREKEYKLIIWAPTFRQSAYLGYNDSKEPNLLPLFEQSEWGKLNDYLRYRNIKMIVKLHPLQDARGLTSNVLSNLEIYSGEAFEHSYGDIFELMSQSDALISDYSGVFLDYLVLDRPICCVLDDYEDYKNTRGFVFDDPLKYMPGKKAYRKEDIYSFIDDVSNEFDEFQEERRKVNPLVNKYTDGQNCKRLLELANIYK